MSANLPPLPRGRRMGSGVINGKLIELFMHSDDDLHAYATAALAAQAAEVEALRDALREAMQQAVEYDGLDVSKIGPQHWYLAARAALKEQTP